MGSTLSRGCAATYSGVTVAPSISADVTSPCDGPATAIKRNGATTPRPAALAVTPPPPHAPTPICNGQPCDATGDCPEDKRSLRPASSAHTFVVFHARECRFEGLLEMAA